MLIVSYPVPNLKTLSVRLHELESHNNSAQIFDVLFDSKKTSLHCKRARFSSPSLQFLSYDLSKISCFPFGHAQWARLIHIDQPFEASGETVFFRTSTCRLRHPQLLGYSKDEHTIENMDLQQVQNMQVLLVFMRVQCPLISISVSMCLVLPVLSPWLTKFAQKSICTTSEATSRRSLYLT